MYVYLHLRKFLLLSDRGKYNMTNKLQYKVIVYQWKNNTQRDKMKNGATNGQGLKKLTVTHRHVSPHMSQENIKKKTYCIRGNIQIL